MPAVKAGCQLLLHPLRGCPLIPAVCSTPCGGSELISTPAGHPLDARQLPSAAHTLHENQLRHQAEAAERAAGALCMAANQLPAAAGMGEP